MLRKIAKNRIFVLIAIITHITMALTPELREKLLAVIDKDQSSNSPKLQINNGQFTGLYHPFVSTPREQKNGLKDVPAKIGKDELPEIQIFFLSVGQEKNLNQMGWEKLAYPTTEAPKGVEPTTEAPKQVKSHSRKPKSQA